MMRNERTENLVTEPAMSDALQHFELPTNDVPIDFDGWFVDSLDNGGGDRLRWAVLELYGWQPRDGGASGYILYTIGHSVVYHDEGSECGRGVLIPVGAVSEVTDEDLDILVPCPECDPPEMRDLQDDDLVEMEKTWYKWTQCQGTAQTTAADELLLALRKEPKCRTCFHRPHEARRCTAILSCRCEQYREAPRPISAPGMRLLAQVKGRLPDVAQAMQAMNQKKIEL